MLCQLCLFFPSSVLLHDPTVRCGSIIVSFFASSSDPNQLASFVDTLMSPRGRSALSFEFRGSQLNLARVALDPNYPLNVPLSTVLRVIIIVCSVIGGVLLLIAATIVLMLLCHCCSRKNKKPKTKPVKVQATNVNLYDDVYANTTAIDENPVFHLVPKESNIVVARETENFDESYEYVPPPLSANIEYVVSKEVNVGTSPWNQKPPEETAFSFGVSGENSYLM